RIVLHGRDQSGLRAALIDLAPDADVSLSASRFGDVAADVLVACGAALDALDAAAAVRRPLVAGGVTGATGWLVVASTPDVCASCAARAASEGEHASPPDPARLSAGGLHKGPVTHVIGSLMSLAVLKLRLGLGDAPGGVWLRFAAHDSTLTDHPIARAAQCPACTAA